jgi:hypothetical protein
MTESPGADATLQPVTGIIATGTIPKEAVSSLTAALGRIAAMSKTRSRPAPTAADILLGRTFLVEDAVGADTARVPSASTSQPMMPIVTNDSLFGKDSTFSQNASHDGSAWAAAMPPSAVAKHPQQPAQSTAAAASTTAASSRVTTPATPQSMTSPLNPLKPSVFVVDDDLTQVWRSVVNPAEPAKAAMNLGKLLAAPRALQVAAEFLALPAHVDVLRRIDDTDGNRSRLAQNVAAATMRRLSPGVRQLSPAPVVISSPDRQQDAVEATAAPETFARLVFLGLLPASTVVACMAALLNDRDTTATGMRILHLIARFRLTEPEDSGTPLPPLPTLQELQPAIQRHVKPTSHVALLIARALGWDSQEASVSSSNGSSGGGGGGPRVGDVLRAVGSIPATGGEQAGLDRVAYSAACDTVFATRLSSGIACWDSRVLSADGESGAHAPKILFPDRRFVAMDVGKKRDVLLAVTGPPDVPSVYILDLRGGKQGKTPPTSGTFALMEVDTATAIKSIGWRSATCCVGVCAQRDFALGLYTATGTSDRSIANAHDDYITCLATSPDNDNLLFSGSRDSTVKCWDLRGSTARATVMKGGHECTISSIAVARDVVLSAGLDGHVCLWDVRKLADPLGRLEFDAPILAAASTPKGIAVIATAHQTCAITLHPFRVADSVAVAYRGIALLPNGDGMFAIPLAHNSEHALHAYRLNAPDQ